MLKSKCSRLFAAVVWLGLGGVSAHGALRYWDSNDSAAGAGATPTGTWGVNTFWSTDAAGTSSTIGWVSGDTAVFSAGTDAVNPFTVTVSGVQTVGGISFEEGQVTISGGVLLMNAGSTLSVPPISATISSVIVGSIGTLTKTGSGTLILSGANLYGGITAATAGVISVENSTALGSPSYNTTNVNGAAIEVSGDVVVAEPLTLTGLGIANGGALRNGSGTNEWTGMVTIGTGNGQTVRINSDAGQLKLSGIIAGPSNSKLIVGGAGETIIGTGATYGGSASSLTKDGTGTLTISGSTNHRYKTEVNEGTMKAGRNEPFDNSGGGFTDLSVAAAGTFDLNGYRVTLDALDGNGLITNGAAPATLTVGGGDEIPTLTTFSGVMGGSLALTKTGTGTQILSGNNAYTGATIVSNGVLLVNGSLGGSPVLVESEGTLGGTGTIGGLVTAVSGGRLSPGGSIAIMTIDGGLDLSGGGAYVWELAVNATNGPGANFDQVVVAGGDLTLGGAATLNLQFIGSATAPDTNNAFWQSRQSWKIISLEGGANPGHQHFPIVQNGGYAAGYFSTLAEGNGDIVLTFTPVNLITNTVNFATATGRAFPPGVRGQNPHRREDNPSVTAMFAMSGPSLMRGPPGGLDADSYDWRVYNGGSAWGAPVWASSTTSLDFLRKCRDTGSEPLFPANMFGGGYTNAPWGTWVCEFDNHTNIYNPGGYGTNSVPGTAAQLAADWVRYCNIIVPTYRQGQESLIGDDPNFSPTDNAENLRVYNSVAIGGDWGGRDLLLTNGEPAVPKVTWWEIGNEPEVNLTLDSTLVAHHLISDKYVYRDRYRLIANSMKAVDSSVKTGPCITTANNGNEWLGRVAEDTNAPLDFVGIHPYFGELINGWPNPTNLMAGLMHIGDFIASHCYGTALTLSNYGGATRFGTKPAGWFWTTPLIASEYNPVYWTATGNLKKSAANGLGVLEHCFHFADPSRTTNTFISFLGANFWAQPQNIPTLTNAFEALRDFGGDRILENPLPGPNPVPDFTLSAQLLRAYVTQQTNGGNKVHLWGLNFSEDTDGEVNFVFTNLPFTPQAVFQRSFGKRGGENSLTNASGFGWTVRELTGSVQPSNFKLTVENASFTILTFQEAAATNWYWDTSSAVGLHGGNGTWSTNELLGNWSTGVTGENPGLPWTDGKDAVFEAALSAGGTITVTGTVSPRAVVVNQANCNFAGAGTINLGVGGMQINAPISITNSVANPMLAGLGGVMVNPGSGNMVVFNCTNSYSGDTVITSGMLALGSRGGIPNTGQIRLSNSGTFNVVAKSAGYVLSTGQMLTGNGAVIGRLIANGTVSPGSSIGVLTFSTNLALAGTTLLDVSRVGSTVTNDIIVCSSTLTYGGTLIVSNSGADALADGDTFHLFTALAHNGAFDNVQLPSLSLGLGWNTSGLGTGVVQVVHVPYFSSLTLFETNLVLSGSNGVNGAEYYLLTSTNVALPMSNWVRLLTNNFGVGGEFNEGVPVDAASPMRFFRLQSGN